MRFPAGDAKICGASRSVSQPQIKNADDRFCRVGLGLSGNDSRAWEGCTIPPDPLPSVRPFGCQIGCQKSGADRAVISPAGASYLMPVSCGCNASSSTTSTALLFGPFTTLNCLPHTSQTVWQVSPNWK